MIWKINYEQGAEPNRFILKQNELEYNATDKKLYTIGKHGEVIVITGGEDTDVLDAEAISNLITAITGPMSNLITANANALSAHKRLNIMHRYDNVSRTFGTTYADGKEWDTFTKTAGTNVMFSWRCPFRNDSTNMGGGFLALHLSIDGGAYASIGNSGYDGGVTVDGAGAVGSMSGTMLLDSDAVRDATSIRIKFKHHSYDGTVTINGSHGIHEGTMGAFYSQITLQEVENDVL